MTQFELDQSIADGDSLLTDEELAIKQQVEADTNVFAEPIGIQEQTENYEALEKEQIAHVNSTKIVPNDSEDGEAYRVSETYQATTPYGEMANETSVAEADEFYQPIAMQAVEDGYTEEEVEAKLGVKKYHADVDTISTQNKTYVDTIVAANSEYQSSFTKMAKEIGEEEAQKLRTNNTIVQLEKDGFVLDPKTGEMTKDGESYSLEGSFAKNMEAHQAQVMFGILGGTTGALAGPQAATGMGAMGAYVGEIIDNVKLNKTRNQGQESVTDEEPTVGSVVTDVVEANAQAAIVASEDVLMGKAVEGVFNVVGKAVGGAWNHFAIPTKTLIQDIKAGNINTALDTVTTASTKSVNEMFNDTTELLSITDGGDAIIQSVGQETLTKLTKGVPLTPDDIASLPVDFKRATVNKELMTNPDLKAELNNVLSDPEAVQTMANLLRQHTDALNLHFKDAGLSSSIDDTSKGITFKVKLDRAMNDTLDLLDMAGAKLSDATRNNSLNPLGVTNLTQSVQAAVTRLVPQLDTSLNMVGADKRTMDLAQKVMSKAENLTDMTSLLDFRKAYNELLRQVKVYDNSAYEKTMRGSKATPKSKVESDIALQLKDDIDALIKRTVDESPMDTQTKKDIMKNWGDSNTLANTVYSARATKLYGSISDSNKGSEAIADNILKSIGSQGGDYASIVSHLPAEKVAKFEENLIVRAIEKATASIEGGELIDYRTLSKRLSGLSKNTANETTRNTIEIIDTYAKLFGSDADLYKSVRTMQNPSSSTGLSRSIESFLKYTGVSLAIHFMKVNVSAGAKFVNTVAPFIGKGVDSIPIAGKYANKLSKDWRDYATSDSITSASIEALKKAGTVQEFAAIAKKSDVLPVKLKSEISKAADALAKAHEEAGIKIDNRNAEVDIWVEKKRQADQAEFEAKEARQRREDAFVKENIPSSIETAKARAASEAERQAGQQVGDPNTVADTIATAREQGGGAGYVPDSNRIPSSLETNVVTIDANGNPVSNAGGDKGWGANRNVNSAQRTGDQDIKDNFLNGGMNTPTYGGDIVEPQKQLPPSKTIVTPQTQNAAIDERLRKARDMSPQDAYNTHPVQPQVSDSTVAGRQNKANSDWVDTMNGNDGIASSGYYNDYDDYLHTGKVPEAQSMAPEAVVNMRANGIEVDDIVKDILDVGAMETKVGARQRLVTKNQHQGNLDVDTYAIQSTLTPKMTERIRAGKGRPDDYKRLRDDIQLYDGMFGSQSGVASATDQIDSFTSGGVVIK